MLGATVPNRPILEARQPSVQPFTQSFSLVVQREAGHVWSEQSTLSPGIDVGRRGSWVIVCIVFGSYYRRSARVAEAEPGTPAEAAGGTGAQLYQTDPFCCRF